MLTPAARKHPRQHVLYIVSKLRLLQKVRAEALSDAGMNCIVATISIVGGPGAGGGALLQVGRVGAAQEEDAHAKQDTQPGGGRLTPQEQAEAKAVTALTQA